MSGTAHPGDAQPGDAQPDNAQPDNAQPDNARPDDARPDDARPDNARPDNALPDSGSAPNATTERVAVRRDPTIASGLRPVAELAERTPIGDAYLGSLVRTQLMLSLRTSLVLFIVLVSTPLTFALIPSLRKTSLMGVPIGWLLLGCVIYPVLVGIGIAFVRRATRTEAEFVDLVTDEKVGH